MNTIKSILIVSIALFFLLSCEKEIEFKGKEVEPMLVLNGFLTPDSVVKVHLSQSHFIFDTDLTYKAIENADVELFVNGAPRETLRHTGNGSYRGTYKPRERDVIAIQASAGSLRPVRAQTVIPVAPVIELADSTINYNWEDSWIYGGNGVATGAKELIQTNQIKLRLKEPANEKNSYFIKAGKTVFLNDGNVFTRQVDVDIKSVLKGYIISDTGGLFDFITDSEDDWKYSRIKNLFSDDLINGQDVLMEFDFVDIIKQVSVVNGEIQDNNLVRGEIENTIHLSSMSEEYYRFFVSSIKADNSEESPFDEPVQVTSNVENGAGILGSYTTSKFAYRFESYCANLYY
jgi:hypothetical protein